MFFVATLVWMISILHRRKIATYICRILWLPEVNNYLFTASRGKNFETLWLSIYSPRYHEISEENRFKLGRRRIYLLLTFQQVFDYRIAYDRV
jgi:hypothetical protein